MKIRDDNYLRKLICSYFKTESEIIIGENYTVIGFPIYLSNRDFVEISIKEISDEKIELSDRGYTLAELKMLGIDFERRSKINEFSKNIIKYSNFQFKDERIVQIIEIDSLLDSIMDLIYIRNSIDNYAKYSQSLSTTRPFNGNCRRFFDDNSIKIDSGRVFTKISENDIRFDFFAPRKHFDIKTFSYSTQSNALNSAERWDSRLKRIKEKKGILKTIAIYNDDVLEWPRERIEILDLEFNHSIAWSKRHKITKILI
jgi:hypothetical protein